MKVRYTRFEVVFRETTLVFYGKFIRINESTVCY